MITDLQHNDPTNVPILYSASNHDYFTHWPPVEHRECAAVSWRLRTQAYYFERILDPFMADLSQSQAECISASQSKPSLSTMKTKDSDYTAVASRTQTSESHPSYARSALSPSSLNPVPPKKDPKYFCTHCPGEFKWKGDWKRHEAHKHEHQDEYTCESCPQVTSCIRGPYYTKRDFDRHHKKAHKCHSCPKTDACRRGLPKKRAWGCGFCCQALLTWDERIDHIAQHYEEGSKPSEWDYSSVILSLLMQPSVIDAWKTLINARFGFHSEQWLVCRWSQENTVGLQAGLEGDCEDLENLATEALDLAHVEFAGTGPQFTSWTGNPCNSFAPSFAIDHESRIQPSYTNSSEKIHYSEAAFVSTPDTTSSLAMPSSSTLPHFPSHHRNDIYHGSPSQHSPAPSQWVIHPRVVDPNSYQLQHTAYMDETESKQVLRSQARSKSDRTPNPLLKLDEIVSRKGYTCDQRVET